MINLQKYSIIKQCRILQALLIVAFSLVSTNAFAYYDFKVDGIYYSMNGDGTVAVVQGDTDYNGDIVIPSSVTYSGITFPVTRIGRCAFSWCDNLKSVSIPNSVIFIGEYAFNECSRLRSVNIPESVTWIRDYTFWFCNNLENVNIPNSVTKIGQGAFCDCRSLTSINIPDAVYYIDDYAFSYCSSLTSINIPGSIEFIGDGVFCGCSGLTSISIPNTITSIGKNAFYACNGLTSVDIPNSVTKIGDSAFEKCSGLESINLPNSFPKIGSKAFSECSSLTSISIPNSVTSIGDYAFYCCSSLSNIDISGSITSIGDNAFYKCTSLKSANLPNSLSSIGLCAFQDCSELTSVYISKSLTEIGNYAFTGCENLTRVDISDIEAWLKIKFTTSDSNPLALAHHLFLNGAEVKYLTIPNSISKIGNYAMFYCTGLENVTIPESVTEIGTSAFAGCGIKNLNLPKTLTQIGSSAFGVCSEIKEVFYNAENCTTPKNGFVFSADRIQTIVIGKDVKSMPADLFQLLAEEPERVISQSATPPTCAESTFNARVYTAKLYVPSAGKSRYSSDAVWSKFSINGIDTPITSIKLSESNITLKIGDSKILEATIIPTNATLPYAIYWTSSNGSVAIVDKSGRITAVGDGSATISACSYDGGNVIASCNVIVTGSSEEGAVEGVDTANTHIYSSNGSIIIAAIEDGNAIIYDFMGRLIKSVPLVAGDNTAVAVAPGYYIVRTEAGSQSVAVK